MTEKEKMLHGLPFRTGDSELMADKAAARIKADLYNAVSDSESDCAAKRTTALKNCFGHCGEGAFIKPPFHCDYGYQISVGDHFFANFDCVLLDGGKITIGDHCMLGPEVCIFAITHPLDPKEREKGIGIPKDVTIGDHVWIGGNATILPGVTLGNNVVVGAGSVVTKSFPDNVVIAGNPAVVIKRLDVEENLAE